MKFIKALTLALFICNTFLFALSNNILADKYLISAKKSIKNKEYSKAINHFEKIFALGVKVPSDIYYFYAKTLKNNNKLEKSLKNFNLYVEKAGRNSKHYQESLGYIVDIEDTIFTQKKETEEKRKQQIDNKRRAPIEKCIHSNLNYYNAKENVKKSERKVKTLSKEADKYKNKWFNAQSPYMESHYKKESRKAEKKTKRYEGYLSKTKIKEDRAYKYYKRDCQGAWDINDIKYVCNDLDSSKKTYICKTYN